MPNITNERLRRLEHAEKELRELKENKVIVPFVEKLKDNLGLLIAYTPREQWPSLFESAFQDAIKEIPTGGYLWLERHKGANEGPSTSAFGRFVAGPGGTLKAK